MLIRRAGERLQPGLSLAFVAGCSPQSWVVILHTSLSVNPVNAMARRRDDSEDYEPRCGAGAHFSKGCPRSDPRSTKSLQAL